MKVIGSTQHGRWLVELHETEVEKLIGKQLVRHGGPALFVGAEFELTEGWRQVHYLKEAHREIPDVVKRLRALADLLDADSDLVRQASVHMGGQPKPKDEP